MTRKSATLSVLSLAQFLIALDYSIIYVALPRIAARLHLGAATMQWVVSAYALLFAGFLVVGGRVADRAGARRVFVAAILGFALASAIGGVAGSGPVLLAARGLQGLSAALLQPAILALIGTTFPAGPARSRAVAVWGGVGAAGLAAGVVLGGLLTTVSWRLTFFINVPLAVLCALSLRSGPGGRGHATRIPAPGAVLGTTSVLALVFGLTFASGYGWAAPGTLGGLGAAVLLFGCFLYGERGGALIDPALRRIGSLRVGAAAAALYMASVGSEFYLLTLLLQELKDYSPLRAGLAFLPLTVVVTAGNSVVGRAVRRVDPSVVLGAGFVIAAAGLLWLTLALPGQSYARDLLPGLLLSGLGHGMIYASMFIIGTHDVPAAQQGTAGALLTTAQYVSGAVTVAVLTVVLGGHPDAADFRAAFAVTAAAAIAGIAISRAGSRSARRVGRSGTPGSVPARTSAPRTASPAHAAGSGRSADAGAAASPRPRP
jgi:MFS family permease